jgi:hypothetical protein
MRVTNQHGRVRRLVLRFFEQSFELSSRTVDQKRFYPARHQLVR